MFNNIDELRSVLEIFFKTKTSEFYLKGNNEATWEMERSH